MTGKGRVRQRREQTRHGPGGERVSLRGGRGLTRHVVERVDVDNPSVLAPSELIPSAEQRLDH